MDGRAPVIGRFDNSYRRLPGRFYQVVEPGQVAAPRVIKVNFELAAELGLSLQGLGEERLAAIFAGNAVPDGAAPLAQAYAGHQFGGFSPQLGDGRANLLGEVVDPAGRRWDVQLKGSGPTTFSRRGDGRAALGPVLREYIVSEAMHALGIPATRALAAVTTGEMVRRETMLPGAVFTRVAASHVRVGTFQYFVARRDADGLRILADYVIARHYPELVGVDAPYEKLLEAVVARQARLIAQWMGVGFIHGVMNTDNMTISGETIDFGPCAFMDAYDPATVFSSIDEYGRYAYANQPAIAQWNLARLAETLLPIMGLEEERAVEVATAALMGFMPAYEAAWAEVFCGKLGFAAADAEGVTMVQQFLNLLQAGQVDFTLAFRGLCGFAVGREDLRALFSDAPAFDAWAATWRARLAQGGEDPAEIAARMRARNPNYIPRNHRVEQAIAAAVGGGDFAPFERLLDVLARPFDEAPEFADYRLPPEPGERVLATFCGT
jgi:uncharacterized protein YdiU (UPF0061 family)